CAPASEYTATPPASLSTLAVMKPGPMAASNSTSRLLQRRRFIGPLLAMPQHRDHVVGRDDAGEPIVRIDDGESNEVVLVEQRGYFVVGRVGRAGDVGLAQIRELRGGRRDR